MQKVLAIAAVGSEFQAIILQQLENIFKKISIPIEDILGIEKNLLKKPEIKKNKSEISSIFPSYPYIELSIPHYPLHREYLENTYQNNPLFNKFILLISEGESYDELILNRNENLLTQECRNWNVDVDFSFESDSAFIMKEKNAKVDRIISEMDIRGKINKNNSQKMFNLLELNNGNPCGTKIYFGIQMCVHCPDNDDTDRDSFDFKTESESFIAPIPSYPEREENSKNRFERAKKLINSLRVSKQIKANRKGSHNPYLKKRYPGVSVASAKS